MARHLSSTGLFGGLQTCTVVAGAWRIIETYGLSGDVVVISGDTGWKNIGVLASKVPVAEIESA
jgi:cysteine synthase